MAIFALLILLVVLLILWKFGFDVFMSFADNVSGRAESLAKHVNTKVIVFSALISLYTVMFLWRVWENDVSALGFNLSVFWVLILCFFAYFDGYKKVFNKDNISFLVPVILMSLSFSMYENPWVKVVTSLVVLPIVFAFFVNLSYLGKSEKYFFDLGFMYSIFLNMFSFLRKLVDGFVVFLDSMLPKHNVHKDLVEKIIIGVVLFVFFALVILIPLLGAADKDFALMLDKIYNFIEDSISWTLIYKTLFFLFFVSLLISCAVIWSRKFEIKKIEYKFDDIIGGIVLIGTLSIYVLFLYLQVEKLFVDALPLDFASVEELVKSGFWELFLLSIINVIFYFLYYKRTNKALQKILIGFSFASLLIILSAARRMFLYVWFYGFSYEKFFASYTVLYAVMLFVCLITFLFQKERKDIFKFLLITFIWMFSMSTVLPMERMIFKTNLYLSSMKDSRVDMYELKILSSDVSDLVKNYENENPDFSAEWEDWQKSSWESWKTDQSEALNEKKWYEKNISNLIISSHKPKLR